MTLTEPTTKRYRRPDRPGFTTTEVLEMTGLSYRVLDYWLRTGAITLARGTTPGSGVGRRYTEDEVHAIHTLVARYQQANADLEAIRSGKAWSDLLQEDDAIVA